MKVYWFGISKYPKILRSGKYFEEQDQNLLHHKLCIYSPRDGPDLYIWTYKSSSSLLQQRSSQSSLHNITKNKQNTEKDRKKTQVRVFRESFILIKEVERLTVSESVIYRWWHRWPLGVCSCNTHTLERFMCDSKAYIRHFTRCVVS